LLADQLIFAFTDLALGLAADRVRRVFGRIAPMLVLVTLVSCAAFSLLPFTASLGSGGAAILLIAIALWAITSSALRAPPWLLLARYAAQPKLPSLAAINLCGLAIASALSPYLALQLKALDPRLPFILASVALALTVAGLVVVERRAGQDQAVNGESDARSPQYVFGARNVVLLFLGAVLLGCGFQAHSFFNSTGLYQRFASQVPLEYLSPVFWIGFSVAMFPGAALAKRFGLWQVIVAASVLGVVSSTFALAAPSLESLVVAQLLAGGAWGTMSMSLCSAALKMGFTGREGVALGVLWSALAVAALARFVLIVAQWPKVPGFNELALWIPPLAWALGAMIFRVLASRRAQV
jgi:Na+/melibiose symporter-like transporter